MREVLEETGYSIRAVRYAGVAEEIFDDAPLRRQYPDYSHRILHLFCAELTDQKRAPAAETDFSMEESVWVDLAELESLPELVPHQLLPALPTLLNTPVPLYLGTIHYNWTEP